MKNYNIELITPDKTLFKGEIISLVVETKDGLIQVLANHMNAVCNIAAGKCIITFPDNTKKNFASDDGILNIRKDKVIITSDFLEWEEDWEKALAEKEKHHQNELIRRKESFTEHRLGSVAIARAFANLKNQKTID
jgi:F-type H+-transporting ATPase subunit epsilon